MSNYGRRALMARSKPLQVPAPAAVHERLRAIAQREDISVAQVVRDLIRAGLEEREEFSRNRYSAPPAE
jgi:cytidylate kinase